MCLHAGQVSGACLPWCMYPQFRHLHSTLVSRLKTLPFLMFSWSFRYLFSCCSSTFAISWKDLAICGNPSCCAVCWNWGYSVLHSSFSPLAAAWRFSVVVLIFPEGYSAVMVVSPPFRCLKKISACSFSLLAVSWNMAAICSYPSFLAMLVKKVYLFLAWLSPANDLRRFCSVSVPFSSGMRIGYLFWGWDYIRFEYGVE